MIALTRKTILAVIFVAAGVVVGAGIATALNQDPPQIQQGPAEYEGSNPFLNPFFFKSFQETVRPMAAYKSKLAVDEEGFYNGTAKGGKEPYQFEWKFSDGVVLTGQSVTRSFGTPGSYGILVTVTDAEKRFNTLNLVTNVFPNSTAEGETHQTPEMDQ